MKQNKLNPRLGLVTLPLTNHFTSPKGRRRSDCAVIFGELIKLVHEGLSYVEPSSQELRIIANIH